MSEPRFTNQLIKEKSPYLLQHAHNPVDWYPWSEEAFSVAKKEDKPIFLSIGYSCCHWCHVMERESFEDQEVASLLNEDFIAIKVDREERPDIDNIYMEVCQGLTGHGGWPLTIIMTWDKKPFFAATYIPKEGRSGLAGLMELLPEVANIWKTRRSAVLESSNKISQWLSKAKPNISRQGVKTETFDLAFENYSQVFDEVYGGFGQAPKFPSPHNLYFLLRYYFFTGEEQALKMVEKTLISMYRGGMYDHIGFGFARYATDSRWLVPHFEKMLYDNALLAIAYLETYQITGKAIYARIADEIFTYVLRDMTSPRGAFYSAEDADSEGEEGRFYVWSVDEITSLLGAEKGQYFCDLYGIEKGGNFEGKSIPNLLKRLITEEERNHIEKLRQELFNYREKRVHPHKDDKILTSWNGLMIAALAYSSRVLGKPEYLNAAGRAADFLLAELRREDGRLLARYREGEALYPAYAADYAYLIWGLIELYQAGFNPLYLKAALELNADLVKYFWDQEEGGFFFYGEDAEQLLARPKEAYDGALPADNSAATLNLLRLARITGNVELENRAVECLHCFGSQINATPRAYAFFLVAALYYSNPGREIVLSGDIDSADSQAMFQEINKLFLPDTVLVFKQTDNEEITDLVPFADSMDMINGQTAAYLCSNFTCQQPTTSPEQLVNYLVDKV
ncbi:MAG: thioredoxin domain-containing protein [Syntrophomonadaceae bacterium]|nr:thioredoxin domain-containing protein [Syntrophomonadaceae bacterium]MDD3890050.1 thioredoxin domain-containing protein [Syntrophomonadaceae bacterium]MDD4548423.1 thioredoxin domain-containing protein [Syntrophomonadaceae bacterium]